LLYRNLWLPFKWIGRKLKFLETTPGKASMIIPFILLAFASASESETLQTVHNYLPIISVASALLLILYSFSSRRSAGMAWGYLVIAQLLILWGIVINMEEIHWTPIVMYMSGVILAGLAGIISLQKIYNIDKNISLNQFHGYAYEQRGTALVFLLSAIGLLGFPITAAFVGIDVFFTNIDAGQIALITLTALCFLFIELAAIRIYCRIFLGLHKKLNHPIAFRSS
jgi:hypothetical protein